MGEGPAAGNRRENLEPRFRKTSPYVYVLLGPDLSTVAVIIGNYNIDSSFGRFSAVFLPNLAPRPFQTGPARKNGAERT